MVSLLVASGVCHDLDHRSVLDEVSVELARGEVVGLVGPNGAGKSTLVKLLAKVWPLQTGAVQLDMRPFAEIGALEFARQVSYLPQRPEVAWSLSVEDVVALGRLPHVGGWATLRERQAQDRDIVGSAIEKTGMSAYRSRNVHTLSGGEFMRVMLARLLAVDAGIVLADEPITGLDPYYQIEVMQLFREEAARGRGVLVVLHDLAMAARYCDRVIVLQEGRVVAEGSPRSVLTETLLQRVYRVSPDQVGLI